MACTTSGYRYSRSEGSNFPTILGTGSSLSQASGNAIQLFNNLYSGCAGGNLNFHALSGTINAYTSGVNNIHIFELTPSCVGVIIPPIVGSGSSIASAKNNYNIDYSGEVGTGCKLCTETPSFTSGIVLQTGNTFIATSVYRYKYVIYSGDVGDSSIWSCAEPVGNIPAQNLISSGIAQNDTTGNFVLRFVKQVDDCYNHGDNFFDIHDGLVGGCPQGPYTIRWTGSTSADFNFLIARNTDGEDWNNDWRLIEARPKSKSGFLIDGNFVPTTIYQGPNNFNISDPGLIRPVNLSLSYQESYDPARGHTIVSCSSNFIEYMDPPTNSIEKRSVIYLETDSLILNLGAAQEEHFYLFSGDPFCSGDCSTQNSGYFDDCGGLSSCDGLSGSFSILRELSVCDISESAASGKFNDLISAGAKNVSRTSKIKTIKDDTNDFVYYLLVKDDLFDKTLFANQLIKSLNNECYYDNLLKSDSNTLDVLSNFDLQINLVNGAAHGHPGSQVLVAGTIFTLVKDVDNLSKISYYDKFCANTKGNKVSIKNTRDELGALRSEVLKGRDVKLVFVKDETNDNLVRGYLIGDNGSSPNEFSVLKEAEKKDSSGTGAGKIYDQVVALRDRAKKETERLKTILNIQDAEELEVCTFSSSLGNLQTNAGLAFPHAYSNLQYQIDIEYEKTTVVPEDCTESAPVTTSATRTVLNQAFSGNFGITIHIS